MEYSLLYRGAMKRDAFLVEGGLKMVAVSGKHAEAIVRWRNDPENRHKFLSNTVFTVKSQLAWVEKQRGDVSDHTYVAMLNDQPIAMVSLYRIDNLLKCGEYGRIFVDQSSRRRGVGITISRWITAMGFKSLGLKMIYANCLANNKPIQTLLGELGFMPTSKWLHPPSNREVIRLEATYETWGTAAGRN
jgi:RimJ/RimL family protein N-acetyltransferase